jgi:type IV pilus assembly protein PilQ
MSKNEVTMPSPHSPVLAPAFSTRFSWLGGLRRAGRLALIASIAVPLALSFSSIAQAADPLNHVRDVTVQEKAERTEVSIVGSSTPTYSVRVEANGTRIIVDVSNADLPSAVTPFEKATSLVAGMLTQTFKTEAGTFTRITLNLAKPATYKLAVDGTSLRVVLAPSSATRAETQVGAKASDNAAPQVAVEVSPSGGSMVQAVRFERTKTGNRKDLVSIDLGSIPAYASTALPSGRIRLELKNTKLPQELTRTLDVTSFGGNVKSVTSLFDSKTGSTFVELERSEEGIASGAQGILSVEGTRMVWSFEIPKNAHNNGPRSVRTVARERESEQPKVITSVLDLEKGDTNLGEPVAMNGKTPPKLKVETVEAAEAGFTTMVNGQLRKGRYSGRRIDLDLKDSDIHNVLRFIADVGKVNIVTADDVQGSVTIRMRNVPWDQALDVVLQAKGLGMVRGGNLIRVAPLAALQKERELRIAAERQEYELTPLETRLIPVSYAQADQLQARAKELLSPRGSIAVDERTNTLIARDIGGNLNFIEELVRSLDTQTPQVLVEARIVEATSRYLRDIGIQWGGDATFSEATGNPTGVAFPSKFSLAGGNYDGQTPTAGLSPFQRIVPQPNFAVNLPAAVGTGQGGALGFSLGSVDSNFNLSVRLSAAEASGMVRIVSSPRILTLDNSEARINQGTLIPFAQVSAQGVQTTFQEAKLQLLVKPHVTADGSVTMHVKINRDEPDFNQTGPRGDPTILKREAETDLLVMDGHTAVIGGIYTRNTGRNVDQVPFFGDIPILGALFQRRRATDTRNELVIFLTPRIVNRAEAIGR